jgi:hypothetical protein
MSEKVGFFEEAPGQFSMTRLLTFMLVSYAIIMSSFVGWIGLSKVKETGDLMMVVVAMTTLLTAVSGFAMGFKLAQKPMEKTDTAITTSGYVVVDPPKKEPEPPK